MSIIEYGLIAGFSGIGLFLITLQIKLGTRLTSIETLMGVYQQNIRSLNEDIRAEKNYIKELVVVSQKALDTAKRAHERIDDIAYKYDDIMKQLIGVEIATTKINGLCDNFKNFIERMERREAD